MRDYYGFAIEKDGSFLNGFNEFGPLEEADLRYHHGVGGLGGLFTGEKKVLVYVEDSGHREVVCKNCDFGRK
jgi:hypothetical protein